MQRLLKQQAKDRALSASLPQISSKKDSRNLIKTLQRKLQLQNNIFNDETKLTSSTSVNSATSRQSSGKRFANSFSSYGNRQVSTYAHMQLQKQYREWEERRKKKKSLESQASSPSTLDTQSVADSLSFPRQAVSSNTATDEQTQTASKQVTGITAQKHIHQSLSFPFTKSLNDLETPLLKRSRPMTSDFRELKLKTISHLRRPSKKSFFRHTG